MLKETVPDDDDYAASTHSLYLSSEMDNLRPIVSPNRWSFPPRSSDSPSVTRRD